jgi:hypothetical protein
MSTAPAIPAGAAAAPQGAAVAPAAKTKVETVPKEIRNRVLSGRTSPATPPAKSADGAPAAGAPEVVNPPAAAPVVAAPGAPEAGAPVVPAVEPKPRVKKVKDGPTLPAAPAAPTPGDGRTVEQIVRDVLPEITRENATPTAAVDPEVQREIDLATFAEKRNPERYAGMAGKVKGFFSSHQELVAAKAKELGGEKSGEFKDWLESDDYKTWVANNRPSYVRGDKQKLAEDLVTERARVEARKEIAPELKALERQTSELRHAPIIHTKKEKCLQIILTDPSETKDPAMIEFAKDATKFTQAHPDEGRLIAAEALEAVELIEEVYKIDLDLVDFNPKAPTAKQAKIRDFSIALNAELRAKHPNGFEAVDGKILVDADTFTRLGLHKDPRYRTFTADEIAGSLAAARNAEVLKKLRSRRDGVTKSIYTVRAEAPANTPSGQANGGDESVASPTSPSAAAPGGRGTPPADPWKSTRRKALSGK